MSQERQVTVRVQKVKRNRIRMKLFLFAALAATLLLITIFAKDICPYDPYAQDLSQAMQPPSATHPMGTDTYGRDMLSRVLIGAQTSISSTFALVAIITVFGTIVGDLREGSATYGQWYGVLLSAENKKQFFIPKNFAHGFLVLSDYAEFAYKCTDFYHPNDEGGLLWSDPDIGVEWPIPEGMELTISEKDQKWGGIKELKK